MISIVAFTMVRILQGSWLPLAALILSGLSLVGASPTPQDHDVADLQRREILDRRRPHAGGVPVALIGDGDPTPVPPNSDDTETTPGDGSDIYRSKKEIPNDPPVDDPVDYPPNQSDRVTKYDDHDPPDEGPPEIVPPTRSTTRVAKGTHLRDIPVHINVPGKGMRCKLNPAFPALCAMENQRGERPIPIGPVAGVRVTVVHSRLIFEQGCVTESHGR